MSSVADAFANICNYLRREEAALRGLGASDLKARLRTGAGTKGHTADAERYKHYRLLNKIEKDLTIEQRQEILEWEAKLCGNQHMEQSDAKSFAQLTDILQRRKTDLQELGKSSLEACFLTNKSNTDKDLKFGRNSFHRKAASLTDAQKEELARWEAEICVDAALRPAIDKDYNLLLEILQRRKTDLQDLGKSSLEQCFSTNKSNTDKDFKFGQNFFIRKAASLTDAQKEELAKWEAEICVDVALRPAVDKDYNRLLEIVEKRKTDLQELGKSSLEECFLTHKSNTDKDLKFGQNFFRRKAASLTDAQKEELARWEAEICVDSAALRPAVDKDFKRLLEILQKRKTDLQELGKSSLEECFLTNKSNADKDLQFGRNFFRRKSDSLTEAQKEELARWEAEICVDSAALRPVVHAQFREVVRILQKRKNELQQLGKSTVEACLRSGEDKDLEYCRNFLRRKKDTLTIAEQQELTSLEEEICGAISSDDFHRFISILQSRVEELAGVCRSNLAGALSCRKFQKDADIKFCKEFWSRNAANLNQSQKEEVDDLSIVICSNVRSDDGVLSPAIIKAVKRFEDILDRRHAELLAVGASSVSSLFGRHVKKQDSELRSCYWFLHRIFPRMPCAEKERIRNKLNNVLVKNCVVPLKLKYEAKLHQGETILGNALPRPRLPKSLRQFYGNSMDAEARVMTFCNRVHEVDTYMMSLEFQDCDYCHEGWFGTRKQKQDLPGGFESECFKKTNFLRASEPEWLEAGRPICENCLLEAKRRAAEGLPKEPVRLTAKNFADPGYPLPETDALTFFEEEILSPIQHIVRIFTLHATGQCELRGHVGNLFQNGPQYVRNIPAAVGDMKMLLIRRCPKDPNRKQRVPFLVSRRRLENAMNRICRPLQDGGSLALQPGGLTTGGYVDLVCRENLKQYADSEQGEEPVGLQVHVIEQSPWEHIERKLFAMWMSTSLELQMAAKLRLLHEPENSTDAVERIEATWTHLRQAMEEECADHVGGQNDIVFNTLAAYLSSKFDDKGPLEVEQILHDELTAVQELASWEEPLVSEGLWSPEDAAGEQTEMELKEDLWEAVCTANESASSKSTIRRFGAARVKGVPILDPPTVTSTNQLIREDQPYYIVAGFVKLFPLGQGDYWAHLQQRQEETLQPLSFWEWLKHLLFRSDGRFQAHPRFYFFALNTALRNKALRARGYFLKRQQTQVNNNISYTTEELFKMGKAQFTKIVSAFEHSMVGSAQEKLRQRSDLEAMVDQIEQETVEEQAHALLHAVQKAVAVRDLLMEDGFEVAAAEVSRVCSEGTKVIEKILSPAVVAAATQPKVFRVAADRETDVASAGVARVAVDRAAAAPQPKVSRVAADREIDVAFAGGARVAVDRAAAAPQPEVSRVAADREIDMASAGGARVAVDRAAAAPQPEVSRVAADREIDMASAGDARVAVGRACMVLVRA